MKPHGLTCFYSVLLLAWMIGLCGDVANFVTLLDLDCDGQIFVLPAGKFKPVYLYPNEAVSDYVDQVTGPWRDSSFSTTASTSISNLLINNTEGILKSSLVNVWQLINVEQVILLNVQLLIESVSRILIWQFGVVFSHFSLMIRPVEGLWL